MRWKGGLGGAEVSGGFVEKGLVRRGKGGVRLSEKGLSEGVKRGKRWSEVE